MGSRKKGVMEREREDRRKIVVKGRKSEAGNERGREDRDRDTENESKKEKKERQRETEGDVKDRRE